MAKIVVNKLFPSVILLLVAEVSALEVFDCGALEADSDSPTVTRTYPQMKIDLIEPEKCLDPIRDFKPDPVKVQVTLLQVEDDIRLEALTCSILVSRQVTFCGHDHLVSFPTFRTLLTNYF